MLSDSGGKALLIVYNLQKQSGLFGYIVAIIISENS